jgi:putative transposase
MFRALEGKRAGKAMKRRQFTPEKVIGLLRQAEVELAQGKRVGEVCRGLGISEQSYYRWRSEYGGLKLEQARRMKDLEKENGRLKKVAELTLDKQILKEALEGNF